jgi:hypothetical protein
VPIPSLSLTSPAIRHGFVLVHDTLCHGVSPAEWDGDNRVVLYHTRAEAELQCIDATEMRADAYRKVQGEPEIDSEGYWVEDAVLHADGSLTLPNLRKQLTGEALRALIS